jgi:agmatine deiminase
VFNDAVLVPVYDSDPAVERAALDILAGAFPQREIVPVPSDGFALDGGAVHCITQTVPRVP